MGGMAPFASTTAPDPVSPRDRCIGGRIGAIGMQARKPEPRSDQIERQILRVAGLFIVVDEEERTLRLSGRVDSAEARQAAEDIAREMAPDLEIQNDLDVE